MIKKHYYKRGDRALWLDLRTSFFTQGMVGGSDIATILHENPYKSAIELFYQAIGFTPVFDMLNEKMVWGTELEDPIAEMYKYYDSQTSDWVENYKLGLKVNRVRRVNALVTNDRYPAMFANIDREVPASKMIIEIKNMNGFVLDSYKEAPTHEMFLLCPIGVPTGYYCQLQQYMMVLAKEKGRFVFLRDGGQMIIHDIEPDEYLWAKMNEASIDFQARVEKGKEVMAKYPDEQTRLQLLSGIEPELTDQETYAKFRNQQLLQRKVEDEEKTYGGNDAHFYAGLQYMKEGEIMKESKTRQTLQGNFLKKEFLKLGVHTFNMGEQGKISYKKRLSVNVHE